MVSSLQIPFSSIFTDTHSQRKDASANLLPKSLFPSLGTTTLRTGPHRRPCSGCNRKTGAFQASLLESPVLWAGRVCIYYALLKAGLAGSQSNPLISETGNDVPLSMWLDNLMGKSEDDEANSRRKLVSKWHPTTKGTLKRSYRVPSKSVGRRLLQSIASLLSEDDNFVDASSHKGCRIRRESAHGETVCCNNVRALFDELPTPHLVVEITAFPAGPLTDKDYAKAEKLEKVLRSGASI
ncbi:hypothetical protein EJ110_NYTH46531 [Nymphaea thermarum]|nr:hypothetical protein EJ110_NYTH46531 [Nymphaea thermarum]